MIYDDGRCYGYARHYLVLRAALASARHRERTPSATNCSAEAVMSKTLMNEV